MGSMNSGCGDKKHLDGTSEHTPYPPNRTGDMLNVSMMPDSAQHQAGSTPNPSPNLNPSPNPNPSPTPNPSPNSNPSPNLGPSPSPSPSSRPNQAGKALGVPVYNEVVVNSTWFIDHL